MAKRRGTHDARYDEIQDRYLDWLLLPRQERVPKTKKAFAEENGISERTVHYWEKTPDFQNKLIAIKREWGAVHHPDILNRLLAIVAEGKDSDAIAASRVLLGHLDVGTTTSEAASVDDKAIAAALEELGVKVVK